MGSVIALAHKFFAMAVILQSESLFFIIRHGNIIGAFCPWVSSLLMVIFCLMILVDRNIKIKTCFRSALIVGLTGWSIMFSAHSMVLLNFVQSQQMIWFVNLINNSLIIYILSSTITFICLFFFYQSFTKTDIDLLS